MSDAEIRKSFTALARDVGEKGVLALDAGLQELRAVGGRARDMADGFAADLARVQVEVASGAISPETGTVVLDRTLEALEDVRLGLGEGAAKEGIRKGRAMLIVARDAAIGLAKILVSAGLASL